MTRLSRLRTSTSGASMAEYGTLCAVMVLGSIMAVIIFGSKVRSYYDVSADLLENPDLLVAGEMVFVPGEAVEPDYEVEDTYGYSEWKNFLYGTPYSDVLTLDGVYDGVFGSDGDDLMNGTSKGEIFIGGPGNDIMIGARGGDTYVVQRGSGFEVIDETGGDANVDTLDMREFALSEISMARMGLSDELLITAGGGDEVMLRQYFYLNADEAHFERFILSDVTFEGAQAFRNLVAEKQKPSGTVWGSTSLEEFRHTVSTDGSYTIRENHNASSSPLSVLTFTDASADEVQFRNEMGSSTGDLVMKTADGDEVRILDQHYYLGKRGILGVAFEGGDGGTESLDLFAVRSKAADDMKSTGVVTATKYSEDFFHDAKKDGSYRLVNKNTNGDPLESFRVVNASPDEVRFAYSEPSSTVGYFDMSFDNGSVVEVYQGFRDHTSRNDEGIIGILFEGDPSTTADDIYMDQEAVMVKAMADMVKAGYVRGWRGNDTVVYTEDDPVNVTYYAGYNISGIVDTLDLSAFNRSDVTFVKSYPNLKIRLPGGREVQVTWYFKGSYYTVEKIIFGDGAGGTVTMTPDEVDALF